MMPNLVDIFSLFIVMFLIFVGAMAGFTKKILSLVSWVLAAAAAFYWFKPVEALVLKLSGMPTLSALVASFGVFLCILIVLLVLCSKISGFIKNGALKGADRLLGAVLGACTAIVVLGVGYKIMDVLEIPSETAHGKQSHIKPWVEVITHRGIAAFQERGQGIDVLVTAPIKTAEASTPGTVQLETEPLIPPKRPPSILPPKPEPRALWQASPGAHLTPLEMPSLEPVAETPAKKALSGGVLSAILPGAKPELAPVEPGMPVYADVERVALTELMGRADS